MERNKKRITGRAKKRAQYNRRFKAINPTDKRAPGPNAGAGKKE